MSKIIFSIYEFLQQTQFDPVWRQEIYIPSFWLLLLSVIIILIFYYLFLNRFWAKYNKISSWFLFFFIAFILNFLLAVIVVSNSTLEYEKWVNTVLPFCLINAFYGILFYFLLSIAFKFLSRNAKKTPF